MDCSTFAATSGTGNIDLNRTGKLYILVSSVHCLLSSDRIHSIFSSERDSSTMDGNRLNTMVKAAEDVIDYPFIDKELLWEALQAAGSNMASPNPPGST